MAMGRPPKSKLGRRAWEKGMSMSQLASRAGISESRLIKAANGKQAITKDEALRIYKVLEG